MTRTAPSPFPDVVFDEPLARALDAGGVTELSIASPDEWAALPATLASAWASNDWYLVRAEPDGAGSDYFTSATVDAAGAVRCATVHARFDGAPPPPSRPRRRRPRDAHRGLVVAALGLDGVGKSTAIDAIARELAPLFTSTTRFHFRPNFGWPSSRPPATDPHGRAPRGVLGGVAKLALWLADWTVGYAIAVRPLRERGALVLFDRHLHDAIVDPARYRFGGPSWASGLLATAPAPDLVLVFDAPVEIVEQRKRELGAAELARQRRAYLDLIARLPIARRVDASQPPAAVAGDAARHIVAELARRTAHELRLAAPPARRDAEPG